MSFGEARHRLIEALRDGRYEHEARDALAEKNLLAVGGVTADDVILMLRRCRGDQFRESPHHFDRTVTVLEFRPLLDEDRWYVKAYFLAESAVFVSVHRAE